MTARDPSTKQVPHRRARGRSPHAPPPKSDRRRGPRARRDRRALLRSRRARDHAEERRRSALLLDMLTPSPNRSPRSAASKRTRSRYRCTADTAIRANICPSRGSATKSSNTSTKAPRASRAWTSWAAKSSPKAARRCASLGEEITLALTAATRAGIDAEWVKLPRRRRLPRRARHLSLASIGAGGDARNHDAPQRRLPRHVLHRRRLLALDPPKPPSRKPPSPKAPRRPTFPSTKGSSAPPNTGSTPAPQSPAARSLCASGEDSYARMRERWF